ncbi:MAG TPA: hypothetical protein PKI61_00475 [bacterium]|nr:hypothetical protein [bacterium]HPT29514.1 hypothetical protein [bacterium]
MRSKKTASVSETEKNIKQLIADYQNRLLMLQAEQQKIIDANSSSQT